MSKNLILYSRSYCHLCDEMLEQLRAYQSRHEFTIEVRDVDDNAHWLRQFDERVPVLVHNDEVICQYHLDSSALLTILEA